MLDEPFSYIARKLACVPSLGSPNPMPLSPRAGHFVMRVLLHGVRALEAEALFVFFKFLVAHSRQIGRCFLDRNR